MSPLMDLRIDAALDGRESEFARAVEAREQRPRSRFDFEGFLAEKSPFTGLIESDGWNDRDFDYAASRFERTGDRDLAVLARHMGGAADEIRRAEVEMQMSQTSEAIRTLGEMGIPLLEQARTPIDNRDSRRRQHPATRAPMMYPAGVTPTAEDIDPDRAARGAMQPAFSEVLKNFAAEVQRLSSLSGNARQRNRLLARAAELRRMATRQYQREMENDVSLSGDPDEPNNVVARLAADMDDEARAAGAQPDDSFRSYDDWADEDRAGSEQRAEDDVALQLDEDLPRVPAPGRRYTGEDQLGDPAAGTDEPRGQRKNIHDDNILQRLRRGTAPFGAGQPRGDDRYGHRVRYSGLKRESVRESGDMTQFILDELAIADFAAHSHF